VRDLFGLVFLVGIAVYTLVAIVTNKEPFYDEEDWP